MGLGEELRSLHARRCVRAQSALDPPAPDEVEDAQLDERRRCVAVEEVPENYAVMLTLELNDAERPLVALLPLVGGTTRERRRERRRDFTRDRLRRFIRDRLRRLRGDLRLRERFNLRFALEAIDWCLNCLALM